MRAPSCSADCKAIEERQLARGSCSGAAPDPDYQRFHLSAIVPGTLVEIGGIDRLPNLRCFLERHHVAGLGNHD